MGDVESNARRITQSKRLIKSKLLKDNPELRKAHLFPLQVRS
jgi:hypothetical protein